MMSPHWLENSVEISTMFQILLQQPITIWGSSEHWNTITNIKFIFFANCFFLRFISDYVESGLGFQISYESFNVSQRSYNTGLGFTAPNGILTSPSYPSNYPDNTDCIYTISQPSGTVILLNFVSMDIEYDEDCDGCCDYLEIRDGSSQTSPLLDILCDSDAPAPIQSSQRHMWMK